MSLTRCGYCFTDVKTGEVIKGSNAFAKCFGIPKYAAIADAKRAIRRKEHLEIEGRVFKVEKKTMNFKKKCKKVICTSTNEVFESVEELSKSIGLSQSYVWRLISTGSPIKGKCYAYLNESDMSDCEYSGGPECKREIKPIAKAIYHYSKHQAFPVLVLSDKSVGRTNFKVQDSERNIYYCTKDDLRNYEMI